MMFLLGAALCIVGFSLPWTLFPLLLRHLPLRRTNGGAVRRVHSVSICIPAANEEKTIEHKINNCRALSTGGRRREILVCSDGSTDRTEDIVKRYESHGVTLLAHERRRGKASALATLAAHATGDIVLFTDASCRLNSDALELLIGALEQDGVGLAAARYQVLDASGAATEAAYFAREAHLRDLASRHGYLFGASGAAMAMHKVHAAALPADTIHDDMAFPLRVLRHNERIVYVPEAVVVDEAASPRATFKRHMRIAAGNVQLLWRAGVGLLKPSIGIPLLLHKGGKLLGPMWLALATVLLVAGAPTSPLCAALALAAGLALIPIAFGLKRAREGQLPKGIAGTLTAVFLAELAIAAGTLKALMQQRVVWHREGMDEDTPPFSVRFFKRAFDVVVSATGLLAVSPLLAILAALIKLDSKGPVLYFQERLTVDGNGNKRPFWMWKLRTMRPDAETKSGPVWAQTNDPRVTRIGRFMRSTRLDEIPQLVNVLRGDMTIVGPRPERPSFVKELEQTFEAYDERLRLVKPGITGWAQIHCEYDSSLESVRTKLLYDLAYAAHLHRFSTWAMIEFKTVLRTFHVMAARRGAR